MFQALIGQFESLIEAPIEEWAQKIFELISGTQLSEDKKKGYFEKLKKLIMDIYNMLNNPGLRNLYNLFNDIASILIPDLAGEK